YQARVHGLSGSDDAWELARALVLHLETIWELPDEGIWEVRGEPQHFTHSKVMAWVAVDRAIRGVEQFGRDAPIERWRALRARIHADVCEKAWNPELGAFAQAYDSRALDASVLVIPLVGF